jgi:hypothetical protein
MCECATRGEREGEGITIKTRVFALKYLTVKTVAEWQSSLVLNVEQTGTTFNNIDLKHICNNVVGKLCSRVRCIGVVEASATEALRQKRAELFVTRRRVTRD